MTRAYARVAELLQTADAVRCEFTELGLALPEPIAALLGDSSGGIMPDGKPRVLIPPPPKPPAPGEAGPTWIWVEAKEMTTQGVVLGVLRAANGAALTPGEIVERMQDFKPDQEINAGSVANVGTRLQEARKIHRTDGAWTLTDPSAAPVLYLAHGWGPPEVFQNYEHAAYRRMAVHHVLSLHKAGLQPMQLLSQMEECTWLALPINKDLVKMDLETLAKEGRAEKSAGTGGKWRAT